MRYFYLTFLHTHLQMALTKLKCFNDFSREPLFYDSEVRKYYPWLDVQLYMAKYSDGKVSRPHMVLYPTLEGFYGLQINKALAGQLTPKQTLHEAQSQFEIIMKQNYYLPYKGQSYDDNVEKAKQLIKELSPQSLCTPALLQRWGCILYIDGFSIL
ncbi:MAG: hypothetical protein AMS17_06870 [Spirochaetes bacterium DG_61]|jgi:hypothetical protein|nr:MAG: hypothetical protein AMS17_06870 [Spirochaetes bacterium DG_61]